MNPLRALRALLDVSASTALAEERRRIPDRRADNHSDACDAECERRGKLARRLNEQEAPVCVCCGHPVQNDPPAPCSACGGTKWVTAKQFAEHSE